MKKLSKQLVIDTATRYIYISLLIDGVEKASVYEEGINNHSVTIIPFLNQVLDQEKILLQDIDEIIIGIGPGSYTGVRIGVTVAKMIGYLNKTKVLTVSSLALMASASDKEFIVPLIDARRGNAFIALYKQENGILSCVKQDRLENIDKFKSEINEAYEIIESGKPDIHKIIESNLLQEIDNIHDLKPNYLRQTEAERNKQKA